MKNINVYLHLIELRYRFFYILFSFSITFYISYLYSVDLLFLTVQPFDWVSHAYQPKHFIFINITEALSTTISVCVMITFLFLIPYVIYQCWSFFIPGCFIHERKKVNKVFLFLFSLFILESIIIFVIIIPEIFSFLSSFEIKTSMLTIELEPRIQSFIFFIFKIYFSLLLVLQIPLFFFLLFRYTILTSQRVSTYRKYMYFACILIAAFFSPPDAFYQSILASLLLFLFEIGIWFGFMYEKKIDLALRN